jgi:glutathione S-transferase
MANLDIASNVHSPGFIEPTEKGFVLYHGLASTCSKKVRMCLMEKELPFKSRLLDLQKFEQHQPEYLALNPNGVVPTLVHNGRPVIESSIIIDYIDDCVPEHPLKPADPYQRAQMRLWMKFSDDVAYKAVFAPTWNRLRERARDGLSSQKLSDTLSQVPTVERRDRWERMAQGGYSETELQAAYQQMRNCLERADTQLQKTKWLAAGSFSLADIAVLPFIDRISNLRPELLDGAYSGLRDWLSRIKERKSFDPAFNFRNDPRANELPNF